jgi:hypothetical protein
VFDIVFYCITDICQYGHIYLIKMGNFIPSQNNQSASSVPIVEKVIDSSPKKILDTNKKYIKHSELQTAFKTFSKDGYLDLNQFNQAICNLLKFDIPQLSFTYLSENLFQLLDKVKYRIN